MTEPEQKLWRHLRDLRPINSHFRRQAAIGPFFADFASHHERLVIEIDGESHASADALVRDKSRSDYLQSNGYRVLRFWNNEIMSNIEGVMAAIQQALADQIKSPPPLTPPRASRGRGIR